MLALPAGLTENVFVVSVFTAVYVGIAAKTGANPQHHEHIGSAK